MAIQGMQADAVQMMSEDDGRAIVAVVIVEGKAMDDAVHRGHDRGAGGPPDIDAEVQTAGFFGVGACRAGITAGWDRRAG